MTSYDPDLTEIIIAELYDTNIKKKILAAIIGFILGGGISIAIYLTGAVQFSDITFSSIPSHFSSVGLDIYRTMLEPYTWCIIISSMILCGIISHFLSTNQKKIIESLNSRDIQPSNLVTTYQINKVILGFIVGGALGTILGTSIAATVFKSGVYSATNIGLHFPIIQGTPELCQQLASDEAIIIITAIALSCAIIGAIACGIHSAQREKLINLLSGRDD